MFGIAACGGDDKDPVTPDAGPTPDAGECVGHGCPGVGPFELPEGGEVRIELFQFAPELEVYQTAFQSFFFTGQNPLNREVGGEAFEHGVPGVECVDFSDGGYFDNGYSAKAVAIAQSRTYFDVGATVTFKSPTGELVLAKQEPGEADLSAGLPHEILYLGDATALPEFNTVYTFSVEGSDDVPGLDLGPGETPFGDKRDDAEPSLFFPRQFNLVEPTEAEYFAGLTFTEGENKTLAWSYDGELDESWPTIATFAAFVDENNQVQAACFRVPAADSITVPGEVLANVPEKGILLLGNFTHVGYDEQQIGNRLDVLGINCKAAAFEKVAAETEE